VPLKVGRICKNFIEAIFLAAATLRCTSSENNNGGSMHLAANQSRQIMPFQELICSWIKLCEMTFLFFHESFGDVLHRLGGITPLGVFSNAFPGNQMRLKHPKAHSVLVVWFIHPSSILGKYYSCPTFLDCSDIMGTSMSNDYFIYFIYCIVSFYQQRLCSEE
jgi:hypothetical protein